MILSILLNLAFRLLFVLNILNPMIDTLSQLLYPLFPLAIIPTSYKLIYLSFKLLNRLDMLKLQLFRNIFLLVISLKWQLVEIQSLRRGKRHENLVPEECVSNVVCRIVVQNYHYYAPDHFTDLMIDEALTNDVKN